MPDSCDNGINAVSMGLPLLVANGGLTHVALDGRSIDNPPLARHKKVTINSATHAKRVQFSRA